MGNFVFHPTLQRLMLGSRNLVTADLRMLLVRGANNVKSHQNAAFLTDLVLDEYTGGGYARQVLTSKSLAYNAADAQWGLFADDVPFGSIAPDSFPATGCLIYIHFGADSANEPVSFHDKGSFPKNGNGLPFTIVAPTTGYVTFKTKLVI